MADQQEDKNITAQSASVEFTQDFKWSVGEGEVLYWWVVTSHCEPPSCDVGLDGIDCVSVMPYPSVKPPPEPPEPPDPSPSPEPTECPCPDFWFIGGRQAGLAGLFHSRAAGKARQAF